MQPHRFFTPYTPDSGPASFPIDPALQRVALVAPGSTNTHTGVNEHQAFGSQFPPSIYHPHPMPNNPMAQSSTQLLANSNANTAGAIDGASNRGRSGGASLLRGDLPNKEAVSGSGVYEVDVTAVHSNRQQHCLTILTDVSWDDFLANASKGLGISQDECRVEVRNSRDRQWVWVVDSTALSDFMSKVHKHVMNARQVPVTLELRNKAVEPSSQPASGPVGRKKANAREDNIPSEFQSYINSPEVLGQLSDIFAQIKAGNYCNDCTRRHDSNQYCLVLPEVGQKETHRSISLEFIAKWSHLVWEKKANKFYPPNTLLADKALVRGSATSEQGLLTMPSTIHHRTPTPEDFGQYQARRRLDFPEIPSLSSPDLPEPGDVIASLTEKDYERSLIPMPTTRDALEALEAVKPQSNFLVYEEALVKAHYKYIDQIAKATPEGLENDTGMPLPLARDLHEYSVGLRRFSELSALKR